LLFYPSIKLFVLRHLASGIDTGIFYFNGYLMMKRSVLFNLLVLLLVTVQAQVNYSFTAVPGTYTQIAGQTPLLTSSDSTLFSNTDEGFANALPIGFRFNYNGIGYTSLNVNVNGFFTFGNPFLPDANAAYYSDSLAGGPTADPGIRPVVAPLWADLNIQDTANLSYAISGNAPNRVFTIQWTNVLWNYAAPDASISFQARLFETTNVIEFIYRQEAGAPNDARAAIGLTAMGIGPVNFLSLTDASSTPGTSTVTETKVTTRPATGQVYRFTPQTCIPPGNIVFTNVSATSATVGWSTSAGATGYEYGISTSEIPPAGNSISTTTTNTTVSLSAGVNYFFARTNCGGNYSAWTKKAVVPCAVNVLPANGDTVLIPATITWNAVERATGYSIMLSADGVNYTNIGTLDSSVGTTAIINTVNYGTTYYWYVRPIAGNDTASGCASNASSFTTEAAPAAPPNDNICNAVTLTLDGAFDCRSTISATVESNEPPFNCSTPNNTVWYKYTPSANGPIVIKLKRNAEATHLFNARVGIYEPTGTCPNLTLIEASTTCTPANLTTWDSVALITPSFTAGTTYYMMIDGAGNTSGDFCISINRIPDRPVCATLISPSNGAANVDAASTLFTWNSSPNATGYIFSAGASNPPDSLFITADTTLQLNGLQYNTAYYWSITPYNIGGKATGCVVDSFTTMPPPAVPANNECTGAIALTTGSGISGTTVGATQSLPASTCSGNNGTADDDVWYSFTTGQAGAATVTLIPNGDFDGVIEVFSGDCNSLSGITCADSSGDGGIEEIALSNLAAGTTYYIRIYSYWGLGLGGTFRLMVSGQALPVTLTRFKGERIGTANVLTWSTASEQNNKGFALQKSADAKDFSTIAFIATKAISGMSTSALQYQFVDSSPFMATSYYRLKQIDHDGRGALSNVVAVNGEKIDVVGVSTVYPNPVNTLLNMVLVTPSDRKIYIVITNALGKVVLQQVVRLVAGNNSRSINVAKLAPGSYAVKAVCGDDCQKAVAWFIKQ
jgi:hypothetical protein